MSFPVGFYCGNLYSCAAAIENAKVKVLENGLNEKLMPMFVSLRDREKKVVELEHLENESNILWNFKYLIGDLYDEESHITEYSKNTYGDFVIKTGNGEQIALVQILALVLRELKVLTDNTLGQSVVDQIVLNAPIFYGKRAKSALLMACRIAKIDRVRFVNDFEAVAAWYALNAVPRFDDGRRYRNVAFVIVEHEYIQVSICTLNREHVLLYATEYDRAIGKRNFDEALLECLKRKMNFNGGDLLGLKACQKSRMECDGSQTVLINNQQIHIDFKTYWTRVESLSDLFKKLLSQCLQTSTLQVDDLDVVEAFGHMGQIPLLDSIVHEVFRKRISGVYPLEESIASGCALHADGQAPKFIQFEPRKPSLFSVDLPQAELEQYQKMNNFIETEAQTTRDLWERFNQLKEKVLNLEDLVKSCGDFVYLKEIHEAAKFDAQKMNDWLETNKNCRKIEDFDRAIGHFSQLLQKNKQKKDSADRAWNRALAPVENYLSQAQELVKSWSNKPYLETVCLEAHRYVEEETKHLNSAKPKLVAEYFVSWLEDLKSAMKNFKTKQHEEEQKERDRLINQLNGKVKTAQSELNKWNHCPYLQELANSAMQLLKDTTPSKNAFLDVPTLNSAIEKLDYGWQQLMVQVENKLINQLNGQLNAASMDLKAWRRVPCLDKIVRTAQQFLDSEIDLAQTRKTSQNVKELISAVEKLSRDWHAFSWQVEQELNNEYNKMLETAQSQLKKWRDCPYLNKLVREAYQYVDKEFDATKSRKGSLDVEQLSSAILRLNTYLASWNMVAKETLDYEYNKMLETAQSQLEEWKHCPYLNKLAQEADQYVAKEASATKSRKGSLDAELLSSAILRLNTYLAYLNKAAKETLRDRVKEKLSECWRKSQAWRMHGDDDGKVEEANAICSKLQRSAWLTESEHSISQLTGALREFDDKWNRLLRQKEQEKENWKYKLQKKITNVGQMLGVTSSEEKSKSQSIGGTSQTPWGKTTIYHGAPSYSQVNQSTVYHEQPSQSPVGEPAGNMCSQHRGPGVAIRSDTENQSGQRIELHGGIPEGQARSRTENVNIHRQSQYNYEIQPTQRTQQGGGYGSSLMKSNPAIPRTPPASRGTSRPPWASPPREYYDV